MSYNKAFRGFRQKDIRIKNIKIKIYLKYSFKLKFKRGVLISKLDRNIKTSYFLFNFQSLKFTYEI